MTMYSIAYTHNPLAFDMDKLGVAYVARKTKAIQFVETGDASRRPELGYILAESLGRDINLKCLDESSKVFKKLDAPLKIELVPFERRLSFLESDVEEALNQFLGDALPTTITNTVSSGVQGFAQFLSTKNIPFVVAHGHGKWNVVIDAPACVVGAEDFRDAAIAAGKCQDLSAITIRPSDRTSANEVVRMITQAGFAEDVIDIDLKTRSFRIKLSIDDLMDPQTRTVRDELFSAIRIATGFSNEPQIEIQTPGRLQEGLFFVHGINQENKSEDISISEVPFAKLPSSVWNEIYPSGKPFIAKGKSVNVENIAECASFLGSALKIDLEAHIEPQRYGHPELFIKINSFESPKTQVKFVELLQETISFEQINVSLRLDYPSTTVTHILNPKSSRVWVGKNGEEILLVSEGQELSRDRQIELEKQLPLNWVSFASTSTVFNATAPDIQPIFAQAYAVEIERRLQTIFGFGEATVSPAGIFLRLPALCEESKALSTEVYKQLSEYPFPIAVLYDQPFTPRQWNEDMVLGLFDLLQTNIVPLEASYSRGEFKVKLVGQDSSAQYSEELLEVLSQIIGNPLSVSYVSSRLIDDSVGIDPILIRQFYRKAEGKAAGASTEHIDWYTKGLIRLPSETVSADFKPCSDVFTFDNAAICFDTAFAIKRLNEFDTRIQFFVADIASFVLPGSLAEKFVLGRLDSRYELFGSRFWNDLLPTPLLEMVSLKEGEEKRCLVFDVTVRQKRMEQAVFTLNGFTVADVPIAYNHSSNQAFPEKYEEELSEYTHLCRSIADYRYANGGVLLRGDSASLDEPTNLVNYFAGIMSQGVGLPLIYHGSSNLFFRHGVTGIVRVMDEIRSNNSPDKMSWQKFSHITESSTLEETASALEETMQSLVRNGMQDVVSEIQRRIVGRADLSTAPVRSQIGSGFKTSARIIPGLRKVSAMFNQSQLLAQYLGTTPRSAQELEQLIQVIQRRHGRIQKMISQVEDRLYDRGEI